MRVIACTRYVLVAFTIAAAFAFLMAHDAQAVTPGERALVGLNEAAVEADITTSQTSVSVLVGNIIKAALSLVGVVFLILMIYGGLRWMTAQGSADTVKKAQDIIKAAIIGLVIVALAFAISSFVISQLSSATTGP